MRKILAPLLAACTLATSPVLAQGTDRASPPAEDATRVTNEAAGNAAEDAATNRAQPDAENAADDQNIDKRPHSGRDHDRHEKGIQQTGAPPAG